MQTRLEDGDEDWDDEDWDEVEFKDERFGPWTLEIVRAGPLRTACWVAPDGRWLAIEVGEA